MVQKAKATEEDAPKNGVRKTTLGELGPNLPLGFIDASGAHVKSMAERPWRMKEEKELAALKDDTDESMSVGQHVSGILATMYSRLGHYDFNELEMAKRRIILSQAFMGDVWYAYVWLRCQSLGSDLKIQVRCPTCRKLFPFVADLKTTEVCTAGKLEDLLWTYELRQPVEILGKKVKAFRMGPARWQMLESAQGKGDAGAAKEVAIRSHVYGLNDEKEQCVLAPDSVDEMGKMDIEHMTAAIDERFLGPNMSIETGPENPCIHCKSKAVHRLPLDWSYDNFFAISSP